MSNYIHLDTIKSFDKKINGDSHVKSARNASFRNDLTEISMDWDHFRKIDHTFSDVISGEMPSTNQKSSGRCWGFAGLNLFRVHLGKKYDLKDFIIVIIYNNYNDLKILSKIKINNNLKIDNQTFKKINISDEKSLNETIIKLKNTYENHWKDINKINTSLKLPLNISIDASEYDKILKFENIMDDLDLVFSYEIAKFDKDTIYYKLIYNGAPNKFLDDLESRGIKINIENKNWKIE